MKYHKIDSIWKRNDNGSFRFDEFSRQEFEYLWNNEWYGTEKIDGTNIRFEFKEGKTQIRGRTDKADIPPFLMEKLEKIKSRIDWLKHFHYDDEVTLFGEGFGNKIQKVGKKYIPEGIDFILFDVNINGWWLQRLDVVYFAKSFGLQVVPTIAYGTLKELVDFVKNGFPSKISKEELQAEGLVLKPSVELSDRSGKRIITKLKTKDFK